jgi:tetratricopeptide (TPR) repeat protein
MPLSGLSICAVADRVVVKEGARRWHAESGQYLLAFEGDPANGSLSVFERRKEPPQACAQDWLDRALELEETDPRAALEAYAQAIGADPKLVDAHVNLGWLLHDAGRLDEAEAAAHRCFDLGTAVGEVDALGYFGAHLLAIRWIQGRDAELLELAEDVAAHVTDPDAEVRAASLRALGRLGFMPPVAVPGALEATGDPVEFVRVQAMRTAVLLPHAEARTALWRGLGDQSWWVRRAAAHALLGLGMEGPDLVQRAARTHPDRYARQMALQVLLDAGRLDGNDARALREAV